MTTCKQNRPTLVPICDHLSLGYMTVLRNFDKTIFRVHVKVAANRNLTRESEFSARVRERTSIPYSQDISLLAELRLVDFVREQSFERLQVGYTPLAGYV
jgi:hypothetical protein